MLYTNKYSVKMWCYKILFIFSATICIAFCTPISECPHGEIPSEVTINNCTQSPCYVDWDGDISMQMKFTSPMYIETLTPYVYVFNSMGLNFTLTTNETNGCNGIMNTICPLMPNELIIYHYTAHLRTYPLVPLTLSFNIFEEDQPKAAVCFETLIFPTAFFNK